MAGRIINKRDKVITETAAIPRVYDDDYIAEIAQEAVEVPVVSVEQVQTSGTKIATITIDETGTDIYAPEVRATGELSEGTLVATLYINGQTKSIYAPTPQTVGATQVQTTGTKIATITIDGTDTDIYAPAASGGRDPGTPSLTITIPANTTLPVGSAINANAWVSRPANASIPEQWYSSANLPQDVELVGTYITPRDHQWAMLRGYQPCECTKKSNWVPSQPFKISDFNDASWYIEYLLQFDGTNYTLTLTAPAGFTDTSVTISGEWTICAV